MYLAAILTKHPTAQPKHFDILQRAAALLLDCAVTCRVCADACLEEDSVADLRRCIQINGDCADVCEATAHVLSRWAAGTANTVQHSLAQACVEACRICEAECQRHAGHHDHCRVCAEACGACAEMCQVAVSHLFPRQ